MEVSVVMLHLLGLGCRFVRCCTHEIAQLPEQSLPDAEDVPMDQRAKTLGGASDEVKVGRFRQPALQVR